MAKDLLVLQKPLVGVAEHPALLGYIGQGHQIPNLEVITQVGLLVGEFKLDV